MGVGEILGLPHPHPQIAPSQAIPATLPCPRPHAPVLDMETAICTPDTSAPASTPESVRTPKKTPTTMGVSMTSAPGGPISEMEAWVEISTQRR